MGISIPTSPNHPQVHGKPWFVGYTPSVMIMSLCHDCLVLVSGMDQHIWGSSHCWVAGWVKLHGENGMQSSDLREIPWEILASLNIKQLTLWEVVEIQNQMLGKMTDKNAKINGKSWIQWEINSNSKWYELAHR